MQISNSSFSSIPVFSVAPASEDKTDKQGKFATTATGKTPSVDGVRGEMVAYGADGAVVASGGSTLSVKA